MSQDLVKSIAAPLALTMPEEDRQAVMAAFAVNCASGSITEYDLPRIKVASGTALWLIPGLEGDTTAQSVEGVVVAARDTRTYYASKDVGNVPPDCSSIDNATGVGKPGGACAACPLAQWESDPEGGAGQACKQVKQLFMVRGASMLPEVVSLPPTSLKAIRQFFLKLATQGIQYYQCILRIELEKAQNQQGKVYGKAVLRFVRRLSQEETARAEEVRAFVASFSKQVTPSVPAE
jgi:hypothetical protein